MASRHFGFFVLSLLLLGFLQSVPLPAAATDCVDRSGIWYPPFGWYTGTCTVSGGDIVVDNQVTFTKLNLYHSGNVKIDQRASEFNVLDSNITGLNNWMGMFMGNFFYVNNTTVKSFKDYGIASGSITSLGWLKVGNSSINGSGAGAYGVWCEDFDQGIIINNTISGVTSLSLRSEACNGVPIIKNRFLDGDVLLVNQYGRFENNTGTGVDIEVRDGHTRTFENNTFTGTLKLTATDQDSYDGSFGSVNVAASHKLRAYSTTYGGQTLGAGASIENYWRADIHVGWLSGGPAANAVVDIYDKNGAPLKKGLVTDANGNLTDVFILRSVIDGTGTTVLTPTKFTAYREKGGLNITNYTVGTVAASDANSFSITLDDVAPPLVVTSPADGAFVTETWFDVKGTTETNSSAEHPINVTIGVGNDVRGPAVDGQGSFTQRFDLPADGPYTVNVTARDDQGNSKNMTLSVTRAADPPDLTVTAPAESTLTNISTIQVSGVTEPGVNLTVNDVKVSLGTGGAFTTSVALKEGPNSITVRAENVHKKVASVKRNVTLDTTPPALVVTSPANGTFTAQNIVSVSGTTEAGAQVDIGWSPAVMDGTSFHADVPLAEGANDITVRAQDMAGNWAYTSVTVVLDTKAPRLIVDKPLDGALTNRRDVQVTGNSELGVVLKVNGHEVPLVGMDFNYTCTLSEGENDIEVAAEDAVGHRTTVTLTVTLDTMPPDISIAYPMDWATFDTASVRLTGTTEEDAIVMVMGAPVDVSATGDFSCDVTLVEGKNTLTVTATDPAGNNATLALTVVRRSGGTQPVPLEVEGLVEGKPLETEAVAITIKGSTDPDAKVTVNGKDVTVAKDGSWTTTVGLAMGENTVTVTARDPGGNEAKYVYKVVRKDTGVEPPPGPGPEKEGIVSASVTLAIGALVAIVLCIAVVALLMLRRKKGSGEVPPQVVNLQPTPPPPPPPPQYQQQQQWQPDYQPGPPQYQPPDQGRQW